MMKLALMRTATGKEDPELSLLQRDKFIRVTSQMFAAQINASQSSSYRHISTSTVQRRLSESGLHGQISAKKPLLKDTNNNKRLAWAKKHEQRTSDRWKSVLWSGESKFKNFSSNRRVFVRCRVGEWIISACVVPTVKHGRGVMVWVYFAGDTVSTVSDLFRCT